MLETLIASYGIGNNNDSSDYKYHLFIIGKNNIKLFFCEEGTWSEDINKRAESNDFLFVHKHMTKMLNDEKMREHIESSLLF